MKLAIYQDIASEHPEFEAFKQNIFRHTLVWEGGSTLHKKSGDSGGWTKYGIAWHYNQDLFSSLEEFKLMTYEEAAAIAFVRYYLSIQADKVPRAVRLMYFDMAFNMGRRTAIKLLQRTIGVHADGIFGKITERYAPSATLEKLTAKRINRYNYLVSQNPRLKKFYDGWINRTNAIQQAS